MKKSESSLIKTAIEGDTYKKRKKHIPFSLLVYVVLGFVILAAIIMPVMLSQYVFPNFEELLIENTEREAVQTGTQMARVVLEGYTNGQFSIDDEMKDFFNRTSKDFNIDKIKVFSGSGITIYSTSEEDIGMVNTKKYFFDVVAKGNIYTQLVRKNTSSLEDQIVTNDVVETYIPILIQNEFIGAFELYYNITSHKTAIDSLIVRSNQLIYILAFIIILVTTATIIGFRLNMKMRHQFETTLHKMANTDRLTGIFNRRRLEELLKWEIDKYIRYKRNSCIFLLDIDHFKNVNDTYGHQIGDDVLVSVVQICEDALRESDIFGRFGGEEFIAILPEIDRDEVYTAAERLRMSVESASIDSRAGEICITISIGIAHFEETDELSIDSIIKKADESLYHAKKNGRNQVYCM